MTCCSSSSDDDWHLSINKSKRGCTDCLFLLAFIAAIVGMVLVFSMAAEADADPNKLVRGVDYDGKICGVDADVQDKPLVAWIYLLDQEYYHFKRCIVDCAETSSFTVPYESVKFLFYCVPNLLNNATKEMLPPEFEAVFNGVSERLSRAVGDLDVSKGIVAAGAGSALILAFLYCIFLRRCAGCMVWTSLCFLVIGAGLTGYTCLGKAKEMKDDISADPDRAKALEGIGYALIVVMVLFLLICVALRKRIIIAIEVVKEASKAMTDIPLMIIFPIIPFLLCAGFVAYWIAGALYLYSVVNPASDTVPKPLVFHLPGADPWPTSNTTHYFEFNEDYKFGLAAHFFHLLWVTQFFVYFTYLVIAGVIGDWYFTEYDQTGNKKRGSGDGELTGHPICSSLGRVLRYHMGTVAFASLILAIIKFIRAMVFYLDQQSKSIKNEKLRKAIMCALQCCLKCLECCLNKINKNALIYTAVYGTSFCTSACSSFQIVWSNLARVAAINMVGDFLILMGKIMVALLPAGICGIILTKVAFFADELSSPIIPCLVIFIASYCIGTVFMIVFETSIDTVFLCFLIDEHNHDKKGTPMLASENLMRIIDAHKDQSERMAKIMKMKTGKGSVVVPAQSSAINVED